MKAEKSKSKKKKQNRKNRQRAAAEAEAEDQEAAAAAAAAVPAHSEKKNKKYEHQASICVIDNHRTFDTLLMLIKEDPPTRMRLSDLAERASGGRWVGGDPITGRGKRNEITEWQMGARGMLVAEMTDETGRSRSPAELALALEFWPHEKCTRDLPQYAKGRFDGRDGRPRGGPGKDFPYDPDFSTAVARHAFPFEILFCCFSIAGVRGALEDTTNMYSCASG